MAQQPILLEQRLNIINGSDGGFVLVPGCEPTSTLTSTRLQSQILEAGCECAIVPVENVLDKIPGSRVERLLNSGHEGSRSVLILPAVDLECPCGPRPDFYSTLKDLCQEATEEQKDLILGCDAFSVDECDNRPEWRQ